MGEIDYAAESPEQRRPAGVRLTLTGRVRKVGSAAYTEIHATSYGDGLGKFVPVPAHLKVLHLTPDQARSAKVGDWVQMVYRTSGSGAAWVVTEILTPCGSCGTLYPEPHQAGCTNRGDNQTENQEGTRG